MSPICMVAKLTQPVGLGSQTDAACPGCRRRSALWTWRAGPPDRDRAGPGARGEPSDVLADDPVPSWADRWGRTVWSAGRKLRSAARKVDGATTGRQARLVDWIYSTILARGLRRDDDEEEQAVWALHFARLQRLLAEGTMILVGPMLGRFDTGDRHMPRPMD